MSPIPTARLAGRRTQLYRDRIPPCAQVLDLMEQLGQSPPDDIQYDEVVAGGLNEAQGNLYLCGLLCQAVMVV